MSKSRRIFKKLFWWLSKSKSRGSSSPKERTSSRETTTGEKEEEKLVIKTNPPVEQPQLKEEEKPVININPPIEEPLEPLKPEEKKENENKQYDNRLEPTSSNKDKGYQSFDKKRNSKNKK